MKSIQRFQIPNSSNSTENMAWAWVDSVQDLDKDIGISELKSVYKLGLPEHGFTNSKKCKKNCKSNPRCYSGLGQQRWLEPKKSQESSDESDIEANLEHRTSNLPAGLINLGNTCYVNSFLQIWFNNIWLREAIYAWNPLEDIDDMKNETQWEGLKFQPLSKVGSLQSLFALMEFSNRRALDPNDFVTKLGLDPQVQQDAQEFSKLFMTLLETSLSGQSNPKVKHIVQNQFCGEYAYVTTCSTCGRESRRPSLFYELVLIIQGKKSVLECLEDYLGEEKLDGDNKYFCDDCQEKRDAIRCVKITKLPPVLNLSLNRFIFDMKTGTRKKLNSPISFPEEIDMSEHLGVTPGTLIYKLSGVLIHIGDNAHQGHYKAHVQNLKTGEWFQYSDTVVESLEGMEAQLGSEVEIPEGKPIKKPRIKNPGSTTAYMLVYMAKTALESLKSDQNNKEDENGQKKTAAKRHKTGQNGDTKTKKTSRVETESFHAVTPNKQKLNALPVTVESEKVQLIEGSAKRRKFRLATVSSSQDLNVSFELLPGETVTKEFSFQTKPAKFSVPGFEIENGHDKNKSESEPYEPKNKKSKRIKSCEDDNFQELIKSEPVTSSMVESTVVFPLGFPDHLRNLINIDNDEFQAEVDTLETSKKIATKERENLGVEMVNIMNELTFEDDSPEFEFVPTDWIKKFFTNPKKWEALDNSKYMCFHEKLDFEKLSNLKAINTKTCEKIIKLTGFEPPIVRMKEDKLCVQCVKTSCRQIQLNNQSGRDAKLVHDLLKEEIDDKAINYWVGKLSLKKWRQMAKDQLVDQIFIETGHEYTSTEEGYTRNGKHSFQESKSEQDNASSESKMNIDSDRKSQSEDVEMDSDDEIEVNPTTDPEEGHVQNFADSSAKLEFNSDILCAHEGLSVELTKRRPVSQALWNIFKSYFPSCPEFKCDERPCILCLESQDLAKSQSKEKQDLAQTQKSSLGDILGDRNRPSWGKPSLNKVYLVSRSFVNSWRHWVRNPGSRDPILSIGNEILLCEHKRLSYSVDLDTETDNESVVYMVTEDEWKSLSDLFEVDYPITVVRKRSNSSLSSEDAQNIFSHEPEVCWKCVEKRFQQEQEEKLVYQDAVIHIRKLSESEKPPDEIPSDPDFFVGTQLNALKQMKLGNGSGMRRSNRRQKKRGEKEIHVQSDMLLKDLKATIMRLFGVATYDQNLWCNGQPLHGNARTLSELRVFPASTIYLSVDEPNSGTTEEEPMNQDPEEGFKGTGLVSSLAKD